jgi:radical SAM superfamily enzyme YgiQ (UPF0313 family)
MAKILFVQNCNQELYGIMSIASYVKKKHKVKLAIGNSKNLIKTVNSFKPDVVGIYVITDDHYWALETAKIIKSISQNIFILLGGPHPTFYREIINDKNIDAICISEGEKPVLKLLDNINNKKYTNIPSLWIKRDNKIHKNKLGLLLNVEEIPIPDRTIYEDFPDIFQSSIMQVVCSRGCPFNCYFCHNYSMKKMYGHSFFRMRKVEDIINDILAAKKHKNVETILFQEDLFGLNKEWFDKFITEYKLKVNLPFYCMLRCDTVTEYLIDKLKEAGCYRVGIGIESGDEKIRNKILNKNLSSTSIKKAVKILKRKKLEFHTFNMFCLPHENIESAWKTLKLNLELKPNIAKSLIFQPYPGTKFYSETVKNNIIKPGFNRFKVNYGYDKDSRYIQRLQKLFMITVRFPLMQYILPILIRLPLDRFYDNLSKFFWKHLYYKQLINKKWS